MSDSVRPHRQQPTRLLHPWDCPGKNTGVGCHFLLQCMKVKSESEVQLCPTSSDPMDYSLPGSSVPGIFQARVLEWVAIAFSKDSGVGSYSLLQGIFLTQGLNLGLLHCRQILYCLSHKESPLFSRVIWNEMNGRIEFIMSPSRCWIQFTNIIFLICIYF